MKRRLAHRLRRVGRHVVGVDPHPIERHAELGLQRAAHAAGQRRAAARARDRRLGRRIGLRGVAARRGPVVQRRRPSLGDPPHRLPGAARRPRRRLAGRAARGVAVRGGHGLRAQLGLLVQELQHVAQRDHEVVVEPEPGRLVDQPLHEGAPARHQDRLVRPGHLLPGELQGHLLQQRSLARYLRPLGDRQCREVIEQPIQLGIQAMFAFEGHACPQVGPSLYRATREFLLCCLQRVPHAAHRAASTPPGATYTHTQRAVSSRLPRLCLRIALEGVIPRQSHPF